MRTWKTVLSVAAAAGFMRYVMDDNPFFGCIGAVVGVGKTGKESLRNSMARNLGTLTGGLVGMGMIYLTDNICLEALGVIPIIMVNKWLKFEDSIVPGCIVYFAVVYLMGAGEAHTYALRRIFETFLGTLIGFGINHMIQPPPFHPEEVENIPEFIE